jgi:hypothetical protein
MEDIGFSIFIFIPPFLIEQLYWREVLHFTLPGSIAQWFSRKIYVGIKVHKLWTEKMTTVK